MFLMLFNIFKPHKLSNKYTNTQYLLKAKLCTRQTHIKNVYFWFHHIPPILTVKSSATIQFLAARSL